MAMGRRSAARSVKAAERRLQVLEARKWGHSFRAIAEKLDISVGQAHEDFQHALAELRALEPQEVEEYRQIELARLDGLLIPLIPKVRQGDQGAIATALRICESRRKLLGVDQPIKVAPVTPDGEESYVGLDEQQLRLDLLRLVAGVVDAGHAAQAEPGGSAARPETDHGHQAQMVDDGAAQSAAATG